MNKKLTFFCSSILSVMLLFTSFIVVNAQTNDNEIEVKKVIQQYFENDFKIMQTHETLDSSPIIANERLKTYVNTKNDLIADWYKVINEKLDTYELYLDYDSIKFKGDICKVNLIKGSDMIFVNSPEVTQKSRNEKHAITLKLSNNEWFIEKDIFDNENGNNILFLNMLDSSDTNYINNLNSEITALETKKKNVKVEAEKYINEKNIISKNMTANTSVSPMGYSAYKPSDAVWYAQQYWGPTTNEWNKDYSKYDSDCTNFISQAIKHGGIPTDNTWKKDSNAWIRVIEIRDWLINKNYAKEYVGDSINGNEGDILQLYSPTYGWYHSLIITYKRPDGQQFITSHTGNHLNYALFNYYPTSSWTNIRTLKLTN